MRHYSDLEGHKNKRYQLGPKLQYTLTEAFKVNELAQAHKDRSKGATFWKEIEFKGLIPGRTGDSMRNFLKVSLKMGLLEYYREYVAKAKYSHQFNSMLKAKD